MPQRRLKIPGAATKTQCSQIKTKNNLPKKKIVELFLWDSLIAQSIKNLPQGRRPGFDSWVRKSPWRSTPVFLLRESHGQRSLAGYSPWDRKSRSDTTWRLNNHTIFWLQWKGIEASHCGGVSCFRACALGCMGFSSCGSQAPERKIKSCGAWP